MKYLKNKLNLLIQDILWYMDDICYRSTFPPSFYATHSQKEIDEITKKMYDDLRKKINEL